MYTPLIAYRGHNFVDVRDVAEGHLRALEIEEAGGQRFILASRTCSILYHISPNTDLAFM